VKNHFLRKYINLRNEVDSLCKKLVAQHRHQIECKKGCSSCCMNFSVFPLEFFALKHFLQENFRQNLKSQSDDGCPFLDEDACTIYEYRPIICRTQGLPLLFTGEEGWELSACELNFNDFDFSEFETENTFPQDKFNSKLYLLNKDYVESLPNLPYKSLELLELRLLVS